MFFPRGSTVTIVPAPPGWFVAWPWKDDAGVEGITLDPVIAWAIIFNVEDYHPSVRAEENEKVVHVNPYPIVSDGVQDIGENCALKSPDGRFNIPHDSMHEDEASFLKHWWALQAKPEQ